MREVVYDIDLDLQEYDIKVCMQNDDINLIVNIFKKEKPYDLAGAKATLNWSKPDGTPLKENMNIDKNMISVTLNKDYTDIRGKARLDIEITKEGTISTFPLVLVIVEKVFQSNKVNNKIVELLDIIKMDEYVDEFLDSIKKKQTELSSQIDENANLLNARMDTFTKLEEGSTTADAELKDIRVGADGTTYSSAGTAVRAIASGEGVVEGAITPEKTNFFNSRKNLYDKSNITSGKFLSRSGVWTYSETLFQSNVCEFDEKITIKGMKPNTEHNVAFFDNTKTWVLGGKITTDSNGNATLETENNNDIAYFSITCLKEYIDKIEIYGDIVELKSNIKVSKENVTFNTVEDYIQGGMTATELFKSSDVIMGGFYRGDTLEWFSAPGAGITPFYSCSQGDEVVIQKTESVHHIVFKNAEGSIFKGIRDNSERSEISFTIPTDATSFAVAVSENELSSFSVIVKRQIELLQGLDEKIIKIIDDRNLNFYIGKSFSILGDSISTYRGWIKDNYAWWFGDGGNKGTNNVSSVKDTWWWKLIDETKLKLVTNCSYSGSTICNTGYNGEDASEKSFLGRMKDICENATIRADIIFVEGGTNDCWAGSPVGELKYSDWTQDDLKCILPAFCYMLDHIKLFNPQARIINIMNVDISASVKESMKEACEHYEVENVELTNITKENGHPNKEGMSQIEEQVLEILKQK